MPATPPVPLTAPPFDVLPPPPFGAPPVAVDAPPAPAGVPPVSLAPAPPFAAAPEALASLPVAFRGALSLEHPVATAVARPPNTRQERRIMNPGGYLHSTTPDLVSPI